MNTKTDSTPAELKEEASLTAEEQFSNAWEAIFGSRQVQVHFPDRELNARVYTLDSNTGYRVTHKKVTLGAAKDAMIDDSEKLNFPNKARRGEDHGRARLKISTVLEIRAWAKKEIDAGKTPTWTRKSVELGIAEGTLRDIVARRTWLHC